MAALIRRLMPDDAAPYRALMLQAYALHPDAFTSSVAEREALPLAWWATRLAAGPDADAVVFGAFPDDSLAGVAGLAFETREKIRHKATLFGMYVPEARRGAGLGRALVTAVLDHARAVAHLRQIHLTVTQGNAPAQALYEACGFRAYGVEPDAVRVGDRYVAKVHMLHRLAQ